MSKLILSSMLFVVLILCNMSISLAETNPYITYQTLSENITQIHGFIETGDYLFGSTRTTPSYIVRINKTNISDYSVITFNDSLFNRNIEQLVFMNSTNKIYGLFMDIYTYVPGGSSYRTGYGLELDPLTLNVTTFLLFNTTTSYSWGQSPGATTDGTYFISFTNTFPIRLIKINVTSHTIKSTTEYAGYSSGHSVIYEQETNTLFGTTTDGLLFKINNSNPASYQLMSIGGTLSDDICLKNNKVFLGDEGIIAGGTYKGLIWAVNKTNISDFESINTTIPFSSYGTFCNNEVFATYASDPGKLVSINPINYSYTTLTFDETYDEVNEVIVTDGKIYVTFWDMNPAALAVLNYSDFEAASLWELPEEPTRDELIQQQIEEEAHNNNAIIFGAFTLIALAILIGAGVLIYKAMDGGFDTMSFTLLAISAIGLSIVILVGYYILSVMANSIS